MRKRAFTVVEVLIAAAIFSVFLIGVFSLFNMGSRMYISGSWKFTKQKEGERFLQVLKERIEQASIPSKFVKDGNKLVMNKAGNIGYFVNKTGTISVKGLTKKQFLTEFIVSKADKSQTASSTPGLILYHVLFCEPQENGLAKLCLYVNNKETDPNYVAKSGEGCKFPPNMYSGNFNADPSLYSFPKSPHKFELGDISSVEINNSYFASGTAELKSPVTGMIITMECPKHPETTLQLRMQAKIDSSLKFVEVSF